MLFAKMCQLQIIKKKLSKLSFVVIHYFKNVYSTISLSISCFKTVGFVVMLEIKNKKAVDLA